jgi:hypothetical protein
MNLCQHGNLDHFGEIEMKSLIVPTALLLALSVPALAQTPTASTSPSAAKVKGAPGPLVGAGLPVLLVGGGIGLYWLVRRRKGQARTQ